MKFLKREVDKVCKKRSRWWEMKKKSMKSVKVELDEVCKKRSRWNLEKKIIKTANDELYNKMSEKVFDPLHLHYIYTTVICLLSYTATHW